jgi:hypothetical protein
MSIGLGSVESMPISVLIVGSYYKNNNSLSFKGFLKFPEMLRDLNLDSQWVVLFTYYKDIVQ